MGQQGIPFWHKMRQLGKISLTPGRQIPHNTATGCHLEWQQYFDREGRNWQELLK
jgi:hypothetical protein